VPAPTSRRRPARRFLTVLLGLALAGAVAPAAVGAEPRPQPVRTAPGAPKAPAHPAPRSAAPAAAQGAAVTELRYASQAGDWVGKGTSGVVSGPTAQFRVFGDATNLNVMIDDADESWDISISAPRTEQLHPGVYRDAERAPFRTGRAPGLDVTHDASGCNEIWGEFAIDQIATGPDGRVDLLEATFTQHCEDPDAPVLTGTLRLSAPPLGFAWASDPGDFVGGGASGAHRGADSLFFLDGSLTSGADFRVDGLRRWWSVDLEPAEGGKLAVGTFEGGVHVSGTGRGCNTTTGSFTITALDADPDGNLTALAATFVQHCEGSRPALRGELHFGA
jgi:hypothetical protein